MQVCPLSAYTALMQITFPSLHRLCTLGGITLAAVLTSGCYTPCESYYRAPVTYVPEAPRYYTPTYQYPTYRPPVVVVNRPAWGSYHPWGQAVCNRSDYTDDHGCGQQSAYSRPAWNSYPPQPAPCHNTAAPPPRRDACYSSPTYYSRPAWQGTWVSN